MSNIKEALQRYQELSEQRRAIDDEMEQLRQFLNESEDQQSAEVD